MDNGCPKCKKLTDDYIFGHTLLDICLGCQLEQADSDVLKAMNKVEKLKQKIAKEKENARR